MPGKSTGRKSRTFGTQTGDERAIVSARDKGVQVDTYPDITVKAKATMQRQERSSFPKLRKSCKEVYLFMRGKKEYVRRLKNAFVKDKRVVANYGGRYLGMAEDVKRYEGDLYQGLPEQCVILIEFPDEQHATRWTESGIFKQKDFPSPADEVEMFCVPVKYLPEEDLCAFQLTEMYGLHVPASEFQQKYVEGVAKLMNSRHIYNGVVATHDTKRLRNCMIRPNTFVLLNCADDESKLTDFYDSKEYRSYRDYRQNAVADTNICFFTLAPVTS